MYYHYRKTRNRYLKAASGDRTDAIVCQFCEPHTYAKRVVSEHTHCYVIENRTHYDQWEMSRVLDHLMVIPKRHVSGLHELNAAERADIMDVIADYEGVKHYEVYARSPVSKTRSVTHQHTHLIKTDHRPGRGLFFFNKPYIVLRLP